MEVASLPKMMKPETDGEATGKCSHRAFRGGWGRRAGTDQSRNLGGPAAREWKHDQRLAGIHNCEHGAGRESERPIVAKKWVTTVEPRGLTEDMLVEEEERPDWTNVPLRNPESISKP